MDRSDSQSVGWATARPDAHPRGQNRFRAQNHVGDDSLFQCIREIRAALGDDERKLIRLVSGRGYLFDPTSEPAQPPRSDRIVRQIQENLMRLWRRGNKAIAAL